MKYVQLFSKISKKDVSIYGGKVASLGEMLQAHIPVPEGFGISVEAHREFKDKPFSETLTKEILEAFKQLKCERVAVRSSAVAEDSIDASWAGQLETYLNVQKDELETEIRKCWKSVEATHVKDYAKDKNLDKAGLLVGVAVQKMVDSEAAGVMFTTNPVTKDSTEMVIEAAYGLGETVVQGIVTPDNYVIDKKLMHVSQFNIQIKEKMMIFKNGKNIIVPVPEHIADRAVFREEEVLELARIGMRILGHYEVPQDIEWAYRDKKFYIVQARPVTTL